MRKEMQVVFVSAAVMATGGLAQAASVPIPALKDAMIFGTSANADTNNASGQGPGMFAGADSGATPNRKRSMIQFDIASNVPAGATITGVTLTLCLGQIAGNGTGSNYPTRTFSLFDLLQDWGEGSSGSPTNASMAGSGGGYTRVTGDSSWDYAMYNSANTSAGKWNAGGPDLHGGNFAAIASASSTFNAPFAVGNAYSWSSAGMVADVQTWLNSTSSNHGWLLKAMNGLDASSNVVDLETSSQTFLGFWTREGAAANSNPGIAPRLDVTYTVPEPGSLLGVGLFLILLRRR